MGQRGGALSPPQHSAAIPAPPRPQELEPDAEFRGLASKLGADPRRQAGRRLNLAVPPHHPAAGGSTCASRRCSAGNERHLWATVGRCVRLPRRWARAFYFQGGGGVGISVQHSPYLRNSLPRSPFPSRSMHANLVHLFTIATTKHLIEHLLCTGLCSGFRHKRNRTGKPPCPSGICSLGEDRRGRRQ